MKNIFNAVTLTLFAACSCSAEKQKVVEVYKNNKIESRNYFNSSGLLIKEISFDQEQKVDTTVLFYKNNLVDSITSTNEGLKEFTLNYFKDLGVKLSVLSKFKVVVPFSYLNSGEVSDISNVFSASDNKFKEEVRGNNRTIIFENIDVNIRFYPSEIEQFIVPNTILHNYELALKSDTVQNEKYIFDGGILYRRYFYKDGILIKIESECKYNDDKKIYKSKKEFR